MNTQSILGSVRISVFRVSLILVENHSRRRECARLTFVRVPHIRDTMRFRERFGSRAITGSYGLDDDLWMRLRRIDQG